MKQSLLIFLFFCILLCGCTSLNIARKEDVAQVRSSVSEELIDVDDKLNEVHGRIDELEQRLDRLAQIQDQQAAELSAVIKDTRAQLQSDTKTRLAALSNKLDNLEKQQTQNRQELDKKLTVVLEEVTSENRELRQQIRTLSRSMTAPTEEGYYVVSKGDTLSGIGAMFGVTSREIIEANGISDPNKIHVGQKLYIPQQRR